MVKSYRNKNCIYIYQINFTNQVNFVIKLIQSHGTNRSLTDIRCSTVAVKLLSLCYAATDIYRKQH